MRLYSSAIIVLFSAPLGASRLRHLQAGNAYPPAPANAYGTGNSNPQPASQVPGPGSPVAQSNSSTTYQTPSNHTSKPHNSTAHIPRPGVPEDSEESAGTRPRHPKKHHEEDDDSEDARPSKRHPPRPDSDDEDENVKDGESDESTHKKHKKHSASPDDDSDADRKRPKHRRPKNGTAVTGPRNGTVNASPEGLRNATAVQAAAYKGGR